MSTRTFPKPNAAIGTLSPLYLPDKFEKRLWICTVIAFWLMAGLIALLVLTLFILAFFGINLRLMQPPLPTQDIEFQIVQAPKEKPIDPNTKIRAQHATRAGRKENVKQPKQQTIRQAGTPRPSPRPLPVARPQPRLWRPTPSPVKAVTPQPAATSPAPAPPRPRVTAPKPNLTATRTPINTSSFAPIKVPVAPGPATDVGPVTKNTSGGGNVSGSTGVANGPSRPGTLPGQFSTGRGSGSGGSSAGAPGSQGGSGAAGQGGRGNYSQYGASGGGTGRPGIDALPEPDMSPYINELQRRIKRNWTAPNAVRGTSIFQFKIAKDGRLLSIRLNRSCGSSEADQSARSAIERSAPFRPLPVDYRHSSADILFTFNMSTGGVGSP